MTSAIDRQLTNRFDAAVMLTWSDWHTELRSNRYHYARRLARHWPVYFVQPDLPIPGVRLTETEIENVTILHVYSNYGQEQAALLNEALLARGCRRPLLWIYNFYFATYVAARFAPLKVYHATEDYFCDDFIATDRTDELRSLLRHVDCLVAVSEGVKQSYIERGGFDGRSIVIPNGCDYRFWTEQSASRRGVVQPARAVAIYQGGISHKIDWALLETIVATAKDWEFWFCGEVFNSEQSWASLRNHRNVKYHGKRSPEEVRELCSLATVGLIPFVQNDWIVERSFPLKAFEYTAAGLPVVTVPIRSLEPFGDLFFTARTAEEFISSMRAAAPTRHDPAALRRRDEAARAQDYDAKFDVLLQELAAVSSEVDQRDPCRRLNVLVLYDDRSTHVSTIMEHLAAFVAYSRNQVTYCACTGAAMCRVDLSMVDVVVIHYSVRINVDRHLSSEWADAIRVFGGYKVLFVQDEYDATEVTRQQIEALGIHLVYTCVPSEFVERVYPPNRFRSVEFRSTLTGYVPERCKRDQRRRPMSQRAWLIGYRGRELPYWYGVLGREKVEIGKRMKAICAERDIPANIEWEDQHRMYGETWYEFIENCRAMLGCESGANVFDDTGSIRRAVEGAMHERPDLQYEDVYDKLIAPHEGDVRMNQISPRIFEAIALRTGLVLYEGEYSGIIKPDVHFIPLRKDWSNVDDVLAKVQDDEYMEELTDRAYRDVIAGGQFTFQRFIEGVDADLAARVRQPAPALSLHVVAHWYRDTDKARAINAPAQASSFRNVVTTAPLREDEAKREFVPAASHSSRRAIDALRAATLPLLRHRIALGVWHRIPLRIRGAIKACLRPIKPFVLRVLRA